MRTQTFTNADSRLAWEFAVLSTQSGYFSSESAPAFGKGFQFVLAGPTSVVISELERVRAVDAIFCEKGDDGVMHVYSVVSEHGAAAYEQLVEAEDRICARLPDIEFSFRVRAHQGRNPCSAVPVGSEPVFVR